MIKCIKIYFTFSLLFLFQYHIKAGQIETNARLESNALFSPSASLNVKYDKYVDLPLTSASPFQLVSCEGIIEFGFDESKNIFHADNLTSVLTFQYLSKSTSLIASGLINETLIIDYKLEGEYKEKNYLRLANTAFVKISSISVITYKDYGLPSQAVVANPKDLYLETTIKADEALLFDFETPLAAAKIGHNEISVSGSAKELEAYWDYMPGAEEYELEYIYLDNYSATSLSSVKANAQIAYDFEHDATRIITTNQYYKIPLVFERGVVLFRVRGVGRSLSNNFARLEGSWSNAGFETGTVSTFVSNFPNQYYAITTSHENDNINWSSVRTFAEGGKYGIGISYEDGVLHNRQSLAKLNTEDKIIAQSSLYDWHGRPAISVLPTPLKQNYFGYKQNLNKSTLGGQFDKSVFDNLALNPGNPCAFEGEAMDPVNSTGAANYYSTNNTDKEGQQALVPDAGGYPYVQIDYYPDQTGRIKRQSLPGTTHQLGSGKEHRFLYVQPSQEELVRLFGTEVGIADNYQKTIDIDPNGQISVSYIDDEGRTIATALSGNSPDNLIALGDASTPSAPLLTTLVNNNNDPLNYTYELSNTFFAEEGEIQTIHYDVNVPTYSDACVPNLCLDCIYELSISLQDDCQKEYLDGDLGTDGNQPITKILGRYNAANVPGATTSCPSNSTLLNFSLTTPTPFTFNVPKTGSYHLVKTLKLSTAPLDQYAHEYIAQNTCIQTLAEIQQQQLSNIDITSCESMDCASCSTSVMNVVNALPSGTLTQPQIDELIAKCNLKCDLQNPCFAKEKLMLMQFKPNGYFGKLSPNLNSHSIFEPTNTLRTILGIPGSGTFTFANPPGSYSPTNKVIDPATISLPTPLLVYPNQLTQSDYIATFNDNYSEPWLKWHPEYCKLKYTCDDLINAIEAYSKQIENIQSFDEACHKGYLTPFPAMFSLPYAPLSTTCPNCTGSTNHYDPLDPSYTLPGTSAILSADKTAAYNGLFAALNNTTYSSLSGTSLSKNIYEYAIACANGANVDITALPANKKFGDDPCTRDKEWLYFKLFYASYKAKVMKDLKDLFINSWSSSNGGCLTNFSVLPAYVKIFPDEPAPSSASTYMDNLDAVSNDPSGSTAVSNAQFTAQCAATCSTYVSNWLLNLSPCFSALYPSSAVWPNLQSHLLQVCNGGCDGQDPFGASNTTTGISITVNTVPYTVSSFNDVLNAYKAQGLVLNNVNCTGYAINFPKPKGTPLTGASSTAPILDACGCNTILDIHAAYLAAGPNCTLSEAEFAKQNYSINLPYFGNYVCACNQALVTPVTNPRQYDFLRVTDQNELHTLFLPESMACRNCKNCNDIADINSRFNSAFPGGVTMASLSPVILTNWLNNTYFLNNTYDEWMTFIGDCNFVKPDQWNGVSVFTKGNLGQKTKDLKSFIAYMYSHNYFTPNISAPNAYILTPANAPNFFASSIWAGQTLATGITSPVVEMRVDYVSNSYYVINLTSTSTSPAFQLSFRLNDIPGAPLHTPGNSIVFKDIFTFCESGLQDLSSVKQFILHFEKTNGSVQNIYCNGSNSGTNSFLTFSSLNNLPVNLTEDKCTPYLCSNSLDQVVPTNPCLQTLINNALNSAQTIYTNYITQQVEQFISNYKNQCYANVTEQTKRGYDLKEYHYTLYYYDRAGNLVHTVPPQGVDVITNPLDIANAVDYVNGVSWVDPFYPKHSLNPSNPTTPTPALDPDKDGINRYITNYEYNTFDAPTTEVTPDGGETQYFYDHVGRLVASQNTKQAVDASYAYTLYDDLGRITEVGVLYLSTGIGDYLTEAILKDPIQLKAFLTGAYHARKEVTKSFYDLPLNATVDALFVNGQQNLRNRVSGTTYEKFHDDDSNTYDHATFYTYDDHGNVIQIVNDNTALKYAGDNNQYKYIDYEYELISGNVLKVSYQKGKPDQYFHKYEYDADNRLHKVYTSNNDVVYTRDAKYFYYQHGPLARTELGEKQVQGTDYAFTIQGWIKGVNSNILSETTDIGKDANATNAYYGFNQGVHKNFAKDAASYSINYFAADYNPIKTASSNFLADMTNLNSSAAGVGFKKSVDAPDLYNGNIASMVTSIYDIRTGNNDKGTVKPQFTAYRYDQLQRITQMKAYSTLNEVHDGGGRVVNKAIDLAANTWITPTDQNYVGIYEMTFDYDKNGNIQHLTRKGAAAYNLGSGSYDATQMDDLTYKYKTAAGITIPSLGQTIQVNNQLLQVTDVATSTYADDIKDQVNVDNYKYNHIGSLEHDASEEIETIEWTAAKKVKSVIRTTGSTKPDLYFEYNAFGQRIAKTVVLRPGGVPDYANAITTHYVLDASGNQLALYKETLSSVSATIIKCTEHMLFGSGRLGMDNTEADMVSTPVATNKLDGIFGRKDYECANHLGNIITTVSDRKLQVQGTSIGLLNDYETPFNYQSNTVVFAGSYSCKLVAPSQQFSPTLRTLVYPGDAVTASVKTYYNLPLQAGAPNAGLLVISFTDDFGNHLYDVAGVEQWHATPILPPAAGWQTLTYNKTVPNALYTDVAHTILYTGNIYVNSHVWNLYTHDVYLDNQNLLVNPLSPIVSYYKPDIKSTTDYYAFGQSMPGRTYPVPGSVNEYNYAHNGQEKDNEIFIGALSAEYWEYDSRTGRRWENDPIVKTWESPYATFANNPIWYNDVKGLDADSDGNKGGDKSKDKGRDKKKSKEKGKDKANEKGKDNSKDKGNPEIINPEFPLNHEGNNTQADEVVVRPREESITKSTRNPGNKIRNDFKKLGNSIKQGLRNADNYLTKTAGQLKTAYDMFNLIIWGTGTRDDNKGVNLQTLKGHIYTFDMGALVEDYLSILKQSPLGGNGEEARDKVLDDAKDEYEDEKIEVFENIIKPGKIVLDKPTKDTLVPRTLTNEGTTVYEVYDKDQFDKEGDDAKAKSVVFPKNIKK